MEKPEKPGFRSSLVGFHLALASLLDPLW